MARIKECGDCGCNKSEHTVDSCKSCYIMYCDNYKEYMRYYEDSKFISPWHKFKLDNLKYLEQCYESKTV